MNMGSRDRVAPRYFRINVIHPLFVQRSPLFSSHPFLRPVKSRSSPPFPFFPLFSLFSFFFFFFTDRVTHGTCKKGETGEERGGEEGEKKMLFQSEKCAARLVDASGKLTFG